MGDLRFLYTALLEHPAFIRGEKNKTIFEEMFNRRLDLVNDFNSFIDTATDMTVFFEDGHTNIEIPYAPGDKCLNLKCGWDDADCNKMVLEDIFEDIPANSYIISVEGVSVDNLIQKMARRIPHENIYLVKSRMLHYPYQNYHLFSQMSLMHLFGRKEKYNVSFDIGGKILTKSVPLTEYDGVADYLPDEKFLSYEVVDDTVIMHLNACIFNEKYRNTLVELAEICNENAIKTFVLDLSRNMGGDSSVIEEFISYTHVKSYRVYEMIDYSSGEGIWITENKEEFTNDQKKMLFPETIICRVSYDTFSSARTFAITLEDNGIATLDGTPMGGEANSYGMPRKLCMPNSNVRFRVSRAYFRRPKG